MGGSGLICALMEGTHLIQREVSACKGGESIGFCISFFFAHQPGDRPALSHFSQKCSHVMPSVQQSGQRVQDFTKYLQTSIDNR